MIAGAIAGVLLLVPTVGARQGPTVRASIGTRGKQANANSYSPALSGNGRFVAFSSWASNLVAGDTNRARDVFVHDKKGGATERVSVGTDGTQANGHSGGPALVPDDTNGAADIFVLRRSVSSRLNHRE